MTMRILVVDGLRHTRLTGYGRVSRGIITALADRGHDVELQMHPRTWDPVDPEVRERLEALPRAKSEAKSDAVIVVGNPGSARRGWSKPSLQYTMNDLGGRLPPDWLEPLSNVDGVIVPGEFHRRVFAQHLDQVYVAAPGAETPGFYPDPDVRARTFGPFTFLYVGSFAYRKGIDLLIEAFLAEFDPAEPVELLLQCSDAHPKRDAIALGEMLSSRPNARVRMNALPAGEDDLRRLYNQAGCFITMTRGEGWCLPVIESLLCETPVIAPRSSGMSEYLSDEMAEILEIREQPILELSTEGIEGGFRERYGTEGMTCFPPSVDSARQAMRRVFSDPDAARAKAQRGRMVLLEHYSWSSCAYGIERALRHLLSQKGVPAAEVPVVG
jgi:glycosyltransferase involved in cell wall biosynthesis